MEREAIIKTAIDAGFNLYFEYNSGNVHRECNTCGFVATFGDVSRVDLTPCGCSAAQNIAFMGELDANKADDTIPACYDL